jgi:tetratricopeptide (TPR) repeat protein
LRRIEEAINTLQEGIRCYPTNAQLHFYLIQRLPQVGKIQEAISAAETALTLLPNEYVFKIIKNLIIPIVYNTSEEISFYRQRFIQGLQNLIQQTSLETPEEKTNALKGISCVANFYLVYQLTMIEMCSTSMEIWFIKLQQLIIPNGLNLCQCLHFRRIKKFVLAIFQLISMLIVEPIGYWGGCATAIAKILKSTVITLEMTQI